MFGLSAGVGGVIEMAAAGFQDDGRIVYEIGVRLFVEHASKCQLAVGQFDLDPVRRTNFFSAFAINGFNGPLAIDLRKVPFAGVAAIGNRPRADKRTAIGRI